MYVLPTQYIATHTIFIGPIHIGKNLDFLKNTVVATKPIKNNHSSQNYTTHAYTYYDAVFMEQYK